MHLTTILPLLLAPGILSAPLVRRATQASDILQQIMPSSGTCANAPVAADCRTAAQAAPLLIKAMQDYQLDTAGQIAAVLALIGVESGDMKYKHNVYPGRPGQGTSAMLMPENVLAYAQSIPALAAGLAAAGGDVAKVLDLVTADEYNFGAAPWWLTAKCAPSVKDGLRAGTDAGFAAYMACVGVTVTDDRKAYWERAKKALNIAS